MPISLIGWSGRYRRSNVNRTLEVNMECRYRAFLSGGIWHWAKTSRNWWLRSSSVEHCHLILASFDHDPVLIKRDMTACMAKFQPICDITPVFPPICPWLFATSTRYSMSMDMKNAVTKYEMFWPLLCTIWNCWKCCAIWNTSRGCHILIEKVPSHLKYGKNCCWQSWEFSATSG